MAVQAGAAQGDAAPGDAVRGDPVAAPGSVLVTGGAVRIGRQISLSLAAAGWHVLVHYRSAVAEAEATVAQIRAAGGAADALRADLSDRAAVERLALAAGAAAAGQGRAWSALVNNAAGFAYDTLATLTEEAWDAHLAVNLRAPVFLTRAFAAQAGAAGGCVVNILDDKINAPNPDYFSYTMGKLALAAATATLALAVAPAVRVCGIAPGLTLPSGDQTAEDFARAHRANPLGRGSTPAEIAEAVLFILGCRALTGQILVIDGGQSLVNPGRDVAFLP